MKLIFAVLFLCSAAVSQEAAAPQSSQQGWACGACSGASLSHHWASDEIEAQRKKADAQFDAEMESYKKCLSEQEIDRKKSRNRKNTGWLSTSCRQPWVTSTGFASQFTLQLGDGQKYQIDICLEHGETRIRRLDYQTAKTGAQPATSALPDSEKTKK